MYSEHKAAQMCAFFLSKEGGRMPRLKLMKLLYLADRESYRRHGHGISGDAMVSMPHGPVLSQTLDHINGHLQSAPGGWDDWIADKADHQVQLKKKNLTRRDLGEMSECDMEVLAAVWKKFGRMDEWTISDYTHEHCAEWEDPNGSSKPIPRERILQAVNYGKKHAGKSPKRGVRKTPSILCCNAPPNPCRARVSLAGAAKLISRPLRAEPIPT